MSEQPGVSDQYRMASPWPVFVALGFAITELGIFLGVFPISVAGVLLFGGAVAGILTEAEYTSELWRTIALTGVAFAGLGVFLGALQVVVSGGFGVDVVLGAIDQPNIAGHRLVSRGLAILAAGVILVATGVTRLLTQRPAV